MRIYTVTADCQVGRRSYHKGQLVADQWIGRMLVQRGAAKEGEQIVSGRAPGPSKTKVVEPSKSKDEPKPKAKDEPKAKPTAE